MRRQPLLAFGSPGGPDCQWEPRGWGRGRTMRNTLACSYDPLDPGEQAVFRQTTVFVGGGTLAAAGAVCDGHDRDVWVTLDTLLSQSLIPAVGGEPGRWPYSPK